MAPVTISRRAALRALGAQTGAIAVWPYVSDSAAAAFAALQSTNAPAALAFLTAGQYATVDALAETIIPTDDDSPGARAARVADYIDLLLSESTSDTQRTWTTGLVLLDEAARRDFDAPFAKLAAAQAFRIVETISRAEADPQAPLERFFKMTKGATIRGTTRPRSASTRN